MGDEILIAFASAFGTPSVPSTLPLVSVVTNSCWALSKAAMSGGPPRRWAIGSWLPAEPFALSFGRVIVTASEGIVELTKAMTATAAIHDVDVAMYEAKSNGKNRLAFFEAKVATPDHEPGGGRRLSISPESSVVSSTSIGSRPFILELAGLLASRPSSVGIIPSMGCCCQESSSTSLKIPD